MDKLKPCPFCGGEAEMHEQTGQSFHKRYCETMADANNFLDEHRSRGVVLNATIDRWYHRDGWKHPGARKEGFFYSVYAEYLLYIPRCIDTGCIGHTCKTFRYLNDAIEAWNRRVNDGMDKR